MKLLYALIFVITELIILLVVILLVPFALLGVVAKSLMNMLNNLSQSFLEDINELDR